MGADAPPTGNLVLASPPRGNAEIIAMHLAHNEKRLYYLHLIYPYKYLS